MTTLALGSTVTVTLAVGESVTVATNGGRWWTTTTPLVGPVVGPSPHLTQTHRTLGPLTGGGTVAITNQTSDTLVYIQTGAGVVSAPVSIAGGTSSTVTLGDQGSVAVANPGGYWSAAITPAIGAAVTQNHGPLASNRVFGPYPAGATVVLNNITGGPLVAVATNSGSSAAVALRFASPTGAYPTGTFTFNLGTGAAATNAAGWYGLLIGQDMQSISLGIPMNYIAATTGLKNIGNALQISAMSVVYNGQFVPVTWSGSQTVTIADATNMISDAITASQFGASKFTKGDTLQVKYISTSSAPTTDKFPIGGGMGTAAHVYYDPTKVNIILGPYSTSAAITYSFINGGINGTDLKFGSPLPIILLGNHTKPAVLLLGDSKTRGTGDTAVNGAAGMSRTFFGGIPAANNITCSGLNAGVASGVTSDVLTAAGAPVATLEFWYQFATHSIVGFGTNAFQNANQTALYARLRANGIQPIIQRSLTPRTNPLNSMPVSVTQLTSVGTAVTGKMADTSGLTSGQTYPIAGAAQTAYNGSFVITVVDGTTFTYTAGSTPSASPATGTLTLDDQWRTTKYQVAQSGWNIGGGAETYENFLKSNISTDANFTYYQSTGERAGPTPGTTAYWQWLVNGTAKYATGDGLHETAVGYEANVGTPGSVTTQAGGTVALSLRALVATFT